MILLYLKLRKMHHVDVFEHSELGGAWRINKFNKGYYNAHNNIIVALNKNEEKYIFDINKQLSKYNCKKQKPKGKVELNINYKPKKIYINDLNNLIKNFKKICKSLKKVKVKKVNLTKDKIFFDEYEYDFAFLPSCFDLESILKKGKKINIKSKISISNHLTVIFKNTNLPEVAYTENFDNVFDRGCLIKKKNYLFFTGRVRKKFKKFNIDELINKSKILNESINNITFKKLNLYSHNIIKDEILMKLKLHLKETKLRIIETRQFVKSYSLLKDIKI